MSRDPLFIDKEVQIRAHCLFLVEHHTAFQLFFKIGRDQVRRLMKRLGQFETREGIIAHVFIFWDFQTLADDISVNVRPPAAQFVDYILFYIHVISPFRLRSVEYF